MKPAWIKAFRLALGALDAATVLSMGEATLPGEESEHSDHDAPGDQATPDSGTGLDPESPRPTGVHRAVAAFDRAILTATVSTGKKPTT